MHLLQENHIPRLFPVYSLDDKTRTSDLDTVFIRCGDLAQLGNEMWSTCRTKGVIDPA